MDTFFISPLLQFLQQLPAEGVSILLLIVCMIAILGLFKFFGKNGLYLYNIIAIMSANIQVLRVVQFQFSPEPVALGTIVFATTYLCSDLLTEHYGKDAAKLGIWYCFVAQILMTLLMIMAVGYPLLPIESSHPDIEHLRKIEEALTLLFTPSPRILVASLFAFAVSHYLDVWVFQTISRLTQGKWLWLRTLVSSSASTVVDTLLFSVLAWVLFSPNPVSLSTLIVTYILGTLGSRLLIGALITPTMHLSYWLKPKVLREQATQREEREHYV